MHVPDICACNGGRAAVEVSPQDRIVSSQETRGADRSAPVEARMTVPTCHPDRKHHGRGLCSTCHRRSLEKAKLDTVQAHERSIADDRVKQTREALTKYVYPERDPYTERRYVLLGSKPEKPRFVIAFEPAERAFLSTPPPPWAYHLEQIMFRPIRKCWEYKGLIVEWYDWEARV
jgi:hypothetical protein